MKPRTHSLLLLFIAAALVPATASCQMALPVESTQAAPKVGHEGVRAEAEEERQPLVLVVENEQDLNPSAITSAAYQSKAELFQEPPADADEVILLPEFVVRGDAVDPRREAMMERLRADIRRLESADFDLVRGGKKVVGDFGLAQLTIGNDAERPGFSLVTLEW